MTGAMIDTRLAINSLSRMTRRNLKDLGPPSIEPSQMHMSSWQSSDNGTGSRSESFTDSDGGRNDANPDKMLLARRMYLRNTPVVQRNHVHVLVMANESALARTAAISSRWNTHILEEHENDNDHCRFIDLLFITSGTMISFGSKLKNYSCRPEYNLLGRISNHYQRKKYPVDTLYSISEAHEVRWKYPETLTTVMATDCSSHDKINDISNRKPDAVLIRVGIDSDRLWKAQFVHAVSHDIKLFVIIDMSEMSHCEAIMAQANSILKGFNRDELRIEFMSTEPPHLFEKSRIPHMSYPHHLNDNSVINIFWIDSVRKQTLIPVHKFLAHYSLTNVRDLDRDSTGPNQAGINLGMTSPTLTRAQVFGAKLIANQGLYFDVVPNRGYLKSGETYALFPIFQVVLATVTVQKIISKRSRLEVDIAELGENVIVRVNFSRISTSKIDIPEMMHDVLCKTELVRKLCLVSFDSISGL
ncbi:hypothetical protein V1514DRAFT_46336 [Lipomyces japonicus]|uniref:uncharacterized protein n=1 Tax=Lipomyces japonicus TaxID=56871 RepID=UPI0034CFBE0C